MFWFLENCYVEFFCRLSLHKFSITLIGKGKVHLCCTCSHDLLKAIGACSLERTMKLFFLNELLWISFVLWNYQMFCRISSEAKACQVTGLLCVSKLQFDLSWIQIYWHRYLFTFLFCLFTCSSIFSSIHSSSRSFIHSFIPWFICLFVCLFVGVWGCWGVCLFVCLFVWLFVCLFNN